MQKERKSTGLSGFVRDHKLALAAAIAVPTAALACHYWMKRRGGAAQGFATTPLPAEMSSWSAAKVLVWLRAIGCGPDALAAFKQHDIDGSLLVTLREDHLREIGITKLGDRMRITKALEEIRCRTMPAVPKSSAREAIEREDEDEDGMVHTFTQSAAPLSPLQSATAASTADTASGVVQRLEELYAIFGDDGFLELPPQEQQQQLERAAAGYRAVVDTIERLPAEHRVHLEPFVKNFGSLLTQVRGSIVPPTKGSAKTQTLADTDATRLDAASSSTAVDQLTPLLRQFESVLQTDELAKAPADQRAEIIDTILTQLQRMKELAATKLHPTHGASLLKVCQELEKRANAQKGAPPAAAAGKAADPKSASTAGVPFLLHRLRALFETLRDPTFATSLAAKTPAEVRAVVSRLRVDLSSIENDIGAVPDPREREMLQSVAQNVEQILAQLSALGATKVPATKSPMPQPSHPHSVNAKATPAAPREGASAIVARLKAVIDLFQKPEFQANPLLVQDQVLSEVSGCRDAIQQLSPQEQAPLTGLLMRVIELYKLAAAKAAQAAREETEAEEQALSAERDAAEPSEAFIHFKESLEKVFAMISSPDFKEADRDVQHGFCERLSRQLAQIEEGIEKLVTSAHERDALMQLWGSLNGLVNKLVAATGGASAAAKSRAATTATATAAAPAERPPITASQAMKRLQELKNVLTSDEFSQLDGKEQYELARGMQSIIKDIKAKIEAVCDPDDEAPLLSEAEISLLRDKIYPIADQMLPAVEHFMRNAPSTVEEIDEGDESDDEASRSAEEAGEEDGEEGEGDAKPREALFRTIRQATELIESGRITNVADVRECVELLRELDTVGIESADEEALRKRFVAAIEGAIEAVSEQANGTKAAPAQATPAQNSTAKTGAAIGASELIKALREINLVLDERQTEIATLEQLMPFMTAVEDVLAEVDDKSIPWRENEEAVWLVSETLSRIQQLQRTIEGEMAQGEEAAEEDGADDAEAPAAEATTKIGGMLLRYADALNASVNDGTITTAAQLAPFREVLTKVADLGDALSKSDRGAVKALADAIAAATAGLAGEKSPLRGAAAAAADMMSPLNRPGAPPNTPAHPASARPAQKSQSPKNGRGEVSAADGSDNGSDAPMPRLRHDDSCTSEDEHADKRDEDSRAHGAVLDDCLGCDGAEPVPGGTQQELFLVQRVLERLQEDDFVSNTTPFELQSIGSMLLRLERVPVIKGTGLVEVVAKVKHAFAEAVAAFGDESVHTAGGSKDPMEAMRDLPLQLTGMHSENEQVGEKILQYTVFTTEEADGDDGGFSVNERVTGPLLAAQAAAMPTVEAPAAPAGAINIAVVVGLLGDKVDPTSPAGGTTLAELTALVAILDKTYGYDTVVAVDENLSAEELEDVITETIEHSSAPIGQLFVYLCTPNASPLGPGGMPARNYAIAFGDGSSLSHREIMAIVAKAAADGDTSRIAHAVVAQDRGSSVQVLAAVADKTAPKGLRVGGHASVSLTEGARSIVNASRGWLFDGVFTPLLCEMLTVGARRCNATSVAAEDIASYAALVLSHSTDVLPHMHNTVSGDDTLTRPFFKLN